MMDPVVRDQVKAAVESAVAALSEIMQRNPDGWDAGPDPMTYGLLGTGLATAIAALDTAVVQAAVKGGYPQDYETVIGHAADTADPLTAALIGKMCREWRSLYAPMIQRTANAMNKPAEVV